MNEVVEAAGGVAEKRRKRDPIKGPFRRSTLLATAEVLQCS